MSIHLLIAVYAVLLGLIFGSYLNVVIYRLPREISTVLPRSRCPHCDVAIAGRDNIPLLSFLLLGGRCRRCQASISWRYPLIEALCASLFLASFLTFGLTPAALISAFFCAAMIALAAIDLEHYLLPDRITLPGVVVGIAVQSWLPWGDHLASLLGVALGAGVLLAVAGGYYLVRHEMGLGLGDVKMLAMVGAFLGWKGALVTLFFAALTGAAVGLALIALAQGEMKTKLPFGTFLAAAAVAALFWGRPLIDAYLTLL